MLKLLLRLYDPTDGDILLNGIDIRTLKLADLRETVSVLFQDFTLLPFTVILSYSHNHTTNSRNLQ